MFVYTSVRMRTRNPDLAYCIYDCMSEPTLAIAVAFLPALLDSRPLAVGCTHTLINATMMQTSGQRIPTKGRIAPALVTPAADESILKPRIGRDAAVPCGQVCGPVLTRGLLRTRYKMEEQRPKLPLRLGDTGPPPNRWFFGSTTQTSSRSVQPFL